MLKSLPSEFQLSETQKEDNEWAMWIWNSHRWVEGPKGYFNCSYCGANHPMMTAITLEAKICKENPYVKTM